MPRYSKEFREEALALLASSAKSVNALCKELGVSHKTLMNWKREAEDPGSVPRGQLQQENARLKRENERLRMERDILKKAAAFFARAND